MDRAVGITIEKAAELVFQLAHALHGVRDERPREILVGEPRAAFDRVPEVLLDRIARRQCDVVAALDHPRAAAFAEQSLDGDRDRQRQVRLMRMQRGKQPPRRRRRIRTSVDNRLIVIALTPSEASTRAARFGSCRTSA